MEGPSVKRSTFGMGEGNPFAATEPWRQADEHSLLDISLSTPKALDDGVESRMFFKLHSQLQRLQ